MRSLALSLLLLLPMPAICGELRGTVVAVTDGDTFTLREASAIHKIRLSGIDSPELGQDFGRAAGANLRQMIEGRPVVVIWSEKDRYGRLVGTVLVGSLNVNL